MKLWIGQDRKSSIRHPPPLLSQMRKLNFKDRDCDLFSSTAGSFRAWTRIKNFSVPIFIPRIHYILIFLFWFL